MFLSPVPARSAVEKLATQAVGHPRCLVTIDLQTEVKDSGQLREMPVR